MLYKKNKKTPIMVDRPLFTPIAYTTTVTHSGIMRWSLFNTRMNVVMRDV
jgi:hypothetical protein